METIKIYLENMFMNLPNTAEVHKAKEELWQMMEDKYAELIAEGKSENEAVGTVISEFGNLEELAEALGIESVINPKEEEGTSEEKRNPYCRMISRDEAEHFVKLRERAHIKVAIGVLLCITCVIGPIICDAITYLEPFGVIYMFASIAIGVALFIAAGSRKDEWKYLTKEPAALDYAAGQWVAEEHKKSRGKMEVYRMIGVILCCISFVPAAIVGEISIKIPYVDFDDLGGAFLFIFVGVGVYFLIRAGEKRKTFKMLMSANGNGTMGEAFVNSVSSEKEENKSVVVEFYWSTVTCFYLCWSFLTFDWHISWIIWPIAGVLFPVIKTWTKED